MIYETANKMMDKFDRCTIKFIQEKFETNETDPVKLKQIIDESGMKIVVAEYDFEVNKTSHNSLVLHKYYEFRLVSKD